MTTEDGARSSRAAGPAAAEEPAATEQPVIEQPPTEPPATGRPATARPTSEHPTTEHPAAEHASAGPARAERVSTQPSGEPPTVPPAAGAAEATGSVPPPAGAGKPRKKSFLRELPGIVITALVISVLIKTFLVQAFYIPSGSMENTLLVNDRVLVNKLADKPDEIHRGDIVVFRDPGGWLGSSEQSSADGGLFGAIRKGLVFVGLAPAAGEEDLIKRVIGVGGDTVKCCNEQGKITVNGVPLDEPYLFPGDVDHPSDPFDAVTVPKGELWVMGDHRSVSQDSREHRNQPGKGFVPVKDVVGRAFTIVWPLDRARLLHRPATFTQPALESSAP